MVQERPRIMFRFADLLEKHSAKLATLEPWDNGNPLQQATQAELPMIAGLLSGVFNIVFGFGTTDGSAIANRTDVDKVSLSNIQFPAGLRVLVVDDDPTCLKILEKMLRKGLYEVITCSRAVVALDILRERNKSFDVVISDVHMPDMDGFKLLEHIGLEMDLPVIMMSVDDKKEVVMKGVTHGACDYLIKPVRIEAIRNIWQHVVRKRRNELREL